MIYAALAGNLLVAVTKMAAAAYTGSSAMLSESVHSVVDTGNEILLLYGLRRSSQPPDREHPIGYGRELYFWSFIVAVLIFALGAGVSVYEGIDHIRHPEPIVRPVVSYVVLALSFLFEGASWLYSLRQFSSAKGPMGYYEAFRRSKDPPSFMVLFEDSAALLGIVIAAAGIYAASHLNAPIFDGVASILIGLVLAATAGLLARESKSLLIGEQAKPELTYAILRIAGEEPEVSRANGVFTVHLAPDQILAALSLEFADDLRATGVEDAVTTIEREIRAAYPSVVALFIKPQRDQVFREAQRQRLGSRPPDAVDFSPDPAPEQDSPGRER